MQQAIEHKTLSRILGNRREAEALLGAPPSDLIAIDDEHSPLREPGGRTCSVATQPNRSRKLEVQPLRPNCAHSSRPTPTWIVRGLEFNLHQALCRCGRQSDMETTRASVINSSALYMHDRVAVKGLAYFKELLRSGRMM
jgi:hypothetical protein